MKNYYKITPEGTRDYLFEECTAINKVSRIITDVFRSKGYHEALTPGLEFFDAFTRGSSGIQQEDMYKLSDNKGRLLVLRPDLTVPIARMAATRLQKETRPIRLFYSQTVYRNNPALTGRSNEVRQAGIELIGAGGKRADLEVIVTAVEALQKIVPDFRIELGHAGFFKSLAQQLPVSDIVREEIRLSIESKNYSALDTILDGLEQTGTVAAIRRLPRLFGGEEILSEASELFEGTQAQQALSDLKELYHSLSHLCMGGRLIIDLGLVQRNDYYSDMVFSGYVEGSGDAVLIGGRYDKLFDTFDMPMPAAGFGINVDALSKILLQKGAVEQNKAPDVLVHADDGYEMAAINQSRFYTLSGLTCEYSVFTTREEALSYARQRSISKVCFVSEEHETIDL